jgi:hypothetical protein
MSSASASRQGRDLSDDAQDAAQEVQDVAREAANSRWVDRVARAGLISRTTIYLVVAYLTARVALGSGGVQHASTDRPASGQGALATVASRPAGRVAVAVLAVGFLSFALLAVVQAAFRHQEIANTVKRRGKRLFYAGLALLYVIFFLYAGSLVLRPQPSQANSSSSQHHETELAARVLGWPFGQALVGTGGDAGTGRRLHHPGGGQLPAPEGPQARRLASNPRRAAIWALSVGRRGVGAGLLWPVHPGGGPLPQGVAAARCARQGRGRAAVRGWSPEGWKAVTSPTRISIRLPEPAPRR